MSAPTLRTSGLDNINRMYLPELIPVGKSPPPPPDIERPRTPLSSIPEQDEPTPEQLKAMMEHWQKKIYEDQMRRMQEDAKDKMFARVKGNG